jgi:predicted DNA-binding protein with PD1-like motif
MIGSAQSASQQQNMYVLRLKPHADLKQSIFEFAKANTIKAGAIVTCVGSLEQYNLRFANQQRRNQSRPDILKYLSLSGTFSDSVHAFAFVGRGQHRKNNRWAFTGRESGLHHDRVR